MASFSRERSLDRWAAGIRQDSAYDAVDVGSTHRARKRWRSSATSTLRLLTWDPKTAMSEELAQLLRARAAMVGPAPRLVGAGGRVDPLTTHTATLRALSRPLTGAMLASWRGSGLLVDQQVHPVVMIQRDEDQAVAVAGNSVHAVIVGGVLGVAYPGGDAIEESGVVAGLNWSLSSSDM